jgi:hypothetical protein
MNNQIARDLIDVATIRDLINITKINKTTLYNELVILHEQFKNINNETIDALIKASKLPDLIEIAKTNDDTFHTKLVKLHDQLVELRRTLFARATIDIITAQECISEISDCKNCKKSLMELYQINQSFITPQLINAAIQNIKNKIDIIENNQKEKLPPSAKLPLYATDDFIMDMIFFRLNFNAINSTWLK